MDVINRSGVIVLPAEPFLDWLHRGGSPARGVRRDFRRTTERLVPPALNMAG